MGEHDAITDGQRLAAVDRLGLIDTPSEPVFEEFARVVARLLHAPYAFVTIVDDLRSFWKAAHGITDDTRSNPVEESFCQYLIRSRNDLLVDDATVDERTRDNPSIESMGVRAWAGAPIIIDGQVIGSFCVVDTETRHWTEDDREILHAFRDQVEREFEHRRVLQVEQSAHRTDSQSLAELRAELVPVELPAVPGVELAARHRAASDGNDVLGDFYDAFPIDEHRWGIVLGDVCGHGVAAARLTALVRYTLRSAIVNTGDPTEAFGRLDEAVRSDGTDPGRFATLSYLELDLREPSTIRRVSAGHPPPLLVSPDGTVRWLTGLNSQPVGLVEGATYPTETLSVEPGSFVVAYTDGVTDARDGAGDTLGERALEAIVRAAPLAGADEFADHVTDAVLAYASHNLLDDIALVVVRLLPST